MGCLKRYTKPVDGTIPIPALLYEDEDLLASQEGLGIYDGYVPLLPFIEPCIHMSHCVFNGEWREGDTYACGSLSCTPLLYCLSP